MKKLDVHSMMTRAGLLLESAYLLHPSNDSLKNPETGKAPFVIMLHGCGGLAHDGGPQLAHAQHLAEVGIGSIVVDSFAPREITGFEAASLVCSGMRLWGRERAGDLIALLNWARGQDWIDETRLGAIGWSHGGWTIMDSLALGRNLAPHVGLTDFPDAPLAGLKFAGLIYPWCGVGSHTAMMGWTQRVGGQMVLAGRDVVAGTALPRLALRRALEGGSDIDLHLFERATHAYDEQLSINPGFVYDAAAHQETMALMRVRALKDLRLQ